jgi:hypothetical protein
MTFIRRYMSDRAHRLKTEDTTYCNRVANRGERMARPPKLGRCDVCEDCYRRQARGK